MKHVRELGEELIAVERIVERTRGLHKTKMVAGHPASLLPECGEKNEAQTGLGATAGGIHGEAGRQGLKGEAGWAQW